MLEQFTGHWVVRNYPPNQFDVRSQSRSWRGDNKVQEFLMLDEFTTRCGELAPCLFLEDASEERGNVRETVPEGADAATESMDKDSV
ncbi:hypothetical protein NHG22_34555 [Streptomyces sp. ATE26]|uniref:hypothetical protein n=1 Tax=Streptomyces sp. ATE26 TaxID=2954237 RepID=UPI0024826577|nr:hypothetical protein [Streptomyces sp. ATE26]MDI1458897.1 hypothetical protein [Streptomyces sp. ATE26]